MSRPLKYDDQFKSLVKSEMKQKFLFCIPMKVQSSAFYKSLSLQSSLRICSIYDILCGFFVLYCGKSTFIENLLIILFFFFGIMSINNSVNLSKKFSKYYYYWRIGITILIPIREFSQYRNKNICYYSYCQSFIYYSGLTIGILIINLYFTKISWSFNTRLQRGQELLVIHGKYLEQMISNENQKIIDTQNLILQSKYSEIELSNSKPSNIITNADENNK